MAQLSGGNVRNSGNHRGLTTASIRTGPRLFVQAGVFCYHVGMAILDNVEILDERYAFLTENPRSRYSQYCEDGMIVDLVAHLDPPKWCFEVGAGDGVTLSNTKALRDRGWSAMLMESDFNKWAKLGAFTVRGKVYPIKVEVGEDQPVDKILDNHHAPEDFGLGSIDIDGQDYHVWEAMRRRPTIMVVEFSPYVEDPEFIPDIWTDGRGGQNQAGLKAIIELGEEKGYIAVAKTFCNVIFVRADA